MKNFIGCIIEESLEDKSVLGYIKVVSTRVEPVTEKHQTSWVKQWTHHKVEIEPIKVDETAERVSKALDSNHNWYADFKNDDIHYVIYKNKVFKIDRTNEEEYNEATKYGISIGIPAYQVDFSDKVKKWER